MRRSLHVTYSRLKLVIGQELFFIWWRVTAWRIRKQEAPNFLVHTMASKMCIKETIRQLRQQRR